MYNSKAYIPHRNGAGYTLIELLVVIAIISLLSLAGFVSFKSFSADQAAVKAAGQIQSYLRLAQTNASSSTNCNNQQATDWSVVLNLTSVDLRCNNSSFLQKSYVLENAQIINPPCTLPVTFTYAVSTGTLTLPCSAPSSVTFRVSNALIPTAVIKTLEVTKGGTINVQ